MTDLAARQSVLDRFGASGSEIDELLAYNENNFKLRQDTDSGGYPLEDEPFVHTWEGYRAEAEEKGVLTVSLPSGATVRTGSCGS